MLVNLLNGNCEIIKGAFPLSLIFFTKYISWKRFKFHYLILYFFFFGFYCFCASSDSFKIRSENCIELLNYNLSFFKVFQDILHIERSTEYFFILLEVPSSHSLLFYISFSCVVLFFPFFKNALSLSYFLNSLIGFWILENCLNIDLFFHLFTDFI